MGDRGMANQSEYDVAVLGAGIGGYASAIRAAQLGKKVALIEKDKVGGTCLNRGCIPTKTLLAASNVLEMVGQAEEAGIHIGDVTVNFGEVMARKDNVVSRLAQGVRHLIKKNNIELIQGKGVIASKNRIRVVNPEGEETVVSAENIIIASGSEEPKPSYAKVDEDTILTTRGALELKKCPQSLAVIGGGIIGVEFAVIFNTFGAHVEVLDASPNLFPSLDVDIGRYYQRVLKRKGIRVHLNTEVKSACANSDGKATVDAVENGSPLKLTVEKALITDRRNPSSTGIGLEEIGVQTRDGFIVVDEHMRTSVPNIYAVGDVTGGKMYAHVALAEGIVAAENIAGLGSSIDYKAIPVCMYCQPEVASIGLSEEEARQQGYQVAVGKFPLLANGRALTLGKTEGFAKIVCDKETEEILGVHLVAPHATEIIGEAALAMQLECTSEEIGQLIHPHPSVSEALMEAAKAVTGKAIHF